MMQTGVPFGEIAAVRDWMRIRAGQVLHPSPASPAANRGWVEAAEAQLAALGVPAT
jgi:single-strand selective monofunctional uracil DNA glycosylase